MDLNMRAASNGVLVLRHLLQPFLKEPLAVEIHENSVTHRTILVSVARAADTSCPTCQKNPRFGHGNCGPRIGYDEETARRLLDSENATVAAHPPGRSHNGGSVRMPHFLRRVRTAVSRLFWRMED
jgi:hypothetical protein